MENDRSKRVVDRVTAVLDRFGGPNTPTDADPSTEDDTATSTGCDTPASTEDDAATSGRSARTNGSARPITDGGADEASPGESPWIEDDPIVFGEGTESDHGTAILDAVTDAESSDAPPFGDELDVDPEEQGVDPEEPEATRKEPTPGEADADSAAPSPARLDPDRLDELEARIEALESDHVQLESSMTDVAAALADLRGDVETIGTDVRQLVAVLGGIAIASDGTGVVDDGRDEAETPLEPEPDADGSGAVTEPSGDDASSDDPPGGVDTTPDGIHRGAGDPPVARDPPRSDANADAADEGAAAPPAPGDSTDGPPADESADATTATAPPEDPTADGPTGATTPGRSEDAVPPTHAEEAASPSDAKEAETVTDANAATPSEADDAATSERSDDPGRELVDPRTDAVGARLRQFREGFVDDPTADLPTGNTADEFRFEKILLPTDGDAAPDISAGELEKPYLESLPDGYAADAVVLEWLDWLVSAADGATAAKAIAYYESIEWLTGDVRDDLLGYLDGLDEPGSVDEDADASIGAPPSALDLQDHLRSLQYVTELASGEVGADGV